MDRSQQIYFKKLQQEVEYAIRNADGNENGALDIEQLKACFQNLGYLRCLMSEQPPPMRMKQHVTTSKSMLLQEKEFLYNFWCMMNPLNKPEIENALLYDVLLLLIFNV